MNTPVVEYADAYRAGGEIFRTIISNHNEQGELLWRYEVWATSEAVEDFLHLSHYPTIEELKRFSLAFCEQRIKEVGDKPQEWEGAFVVSADKIVYGDYRAFPGSVIGTRDPLVQTNISLPQSLHKWLGQISEEGGTSLSEEIRKALSEYRRSKFVCSSCGLTKFGSPVHDNKCVECSNKEIIRLGTPKRLYPEDIYLSPCFAIKRLVGLRRKHGTIKALTDGKFQREREMWIAGVFLLGMERITKKEYWLRPIEEASTPDIVAVNLSQRPNGTLAEFQNIEIFEYEDHFKGSVVDAIKEKLSGKSYPEDYTLLCYVHGHPGERLELLEIHKQLCQISPKLSQIWLMGSVQSTNPHTYTVVQLFPEPIYHNFDYTTACKETNQRELLRAKRDLTRKTSEVEFEHLGQFILPLP